mmetsp:Transcript_22281/g.33160  ORF Transcript_22281/g.33160 Transcript_22281/m.33160 type:complete len:283 (-) Transcript_22281:33-881(-)
MSTQKTLDIVKVEQNDSFKIEINDNQSVEDVKKIIEKKTSLPVENQLLLVLPHRKLKNDQKNLSSLGTLYLLEQRYLRDPSPVHSTTACVQITTEPKEIEVFVKTLQDKKVFVLNNLLPQLHTILDVKCMIADKTGMPVKKQKLLTSHQRLRDEDTLFHANIGQNTVIYMLEREDPIVSSSSSSTQSKTTFNPSLAPTTPPKEITVYVRTVDGNKKSFVLKGLAPQTHTVGDIKSLIEQQENIPPEKQRLMSAHDRMKLLDEYTLSHASIGNNTVLYLMVHQ